MLAMSHIKAAAENPDWINHAKSQMLELGGTIEPFPFGSKQPIKIERPIDEHSVDDDEEADEEEYAEDESASELKPAATGRKIKIRGFSKPRRLSTSVRKPYYSASSTSSLSSSSSASYASESNKYFIRGQLQPWLATRILRVQAQINAGTKTAAELHQNLKQRAKSCLSS
jgi:hypothetical protein